MGKSRAERREQSGATVNLFSANTTLGWAVVRQVPARYALEQVALRRWREVCFENGELAGVQPLRPAERAALHDVLTERLIAVTITLPELRRNAGLYGPSRTAGMPEWKRLKRHARHDEQKILPPEDAVERAIEKVRRWPYPASVLRDANGAAVLNKRGDPLFGDKAIRVYPHAAAAR